VRTSSQNRFIVLFSAFALAACGLISTYDQTVYSQAVSLKVETLALINAGLKAVGI